MVMLQTSRVSVVPGALTQEKTSARSMFGAAAAAIATAPRWRQEGSTPLVHVVAKVTCFFLSGVVLYQRTSAMLRGFLPIV